MRRNIKWLLVGLLSMILAIIILAILSSKTDTVPITLHETYFAVEKSILYLTGLLLSVLIFLILKNKKKATKR